MVSVGKSGVSRAWCSAMGQQPGPCGTKAVESWLGGKPWGGPSGLDKVQARERRGSMEAEEEQWEGPRRGWDR